ncbi:MAG: hypothetical protein KDC98_24460 [Planctomycetes bacterium]|nr:hypothetical protein [Planctomycetota bacterium]
MNKTILLPVLLLAACGSTSILDQSRDYIRLGYPRQAYHLLDTERQRAFDAGERIDPKLEAAWEEARLLFQLDRGRSYIFGEFDDEALVALAAVLAVDPDNAEALAMRERAIAKKSARSVAAGQQHLAKREFVPALEAFLEAQRVLPTSKAAIEGQEQVRVEVAKLTERAQRQFLEAVRKLPEFRYIEVRWHSANALASDPERTDAEAIGKRARLEIAQERLTRGKENQQHGQFGAALFEYKAAKRLDESIPDIDATIAEVEKEIEASRLAEGAQMHMRRLEFAEARAQLEKAFEMSKMQRAGISELMIENRQLKGEADYEAARDLERQGLKQEALEAFVALSASWPDGLRDEKARIEGLQGDITAARKEWELAVAAEAAGKPAEALEHYITSDQFYSRLHDAKARIDRLRALKAPISDPGGS